MRSIGNSLCKVVVICLVGGICGSVPAGTHERQKETKWGPQLSKGEIEAINELPKSALVELLREGDALHAHAALKRLRMNLDENFDLLLNIAGEKRGDLIVEGLVAPVEVWEWGSEKERVDKFLDFLEAQLRHADPSVSAEQAVRSIGQAVHKRLKLPPPPKGAGQPPAQQERNWDKLLAPPHGFDRAVTMLMSCLEHEDAGVRFAAIGWLSAFGAYDMDRAGEIEAKLRAWLQNELGRAEMLESDKERVRATNVAKKEFKDALQRLHREMEQRDYLLHPGKEPPGPTRASPVQGKHPASD